MQTKVNINPTFFTKIHRVLSKGITDVYLLLKVSVSRNGIQDL